MIQLLIFFFFIILLFINFKNTGIENTNYTSISYLELTNSITSRDGIMQNMSWYPSYYINNNSIYLKTNMIDLLFGSMPEINLFLTSLIDVDFGDIQINKDINKLLFMSCILGIFIYSYTTLPWWVYFTFPSAYKPIYDFYIAHNGDTMFVLMTYLFVLSYSYTEFNNKFLIKLQKYTSLKKVIPINKLLDMLYSISINNIPIINTIINPDLFKDIIIRHILFNYLIYKNYTLIGGSLKTKKSSTKRNKPYKKASRKKYSIFKFDTKFEKYTKKDWYNAFPDNSSIYSLKLLNKLKLFYKKDGIKLLMTCINDYLPHIDNNVNKNILKKVNKYKSHQVNKQFKTFFNKKLLILK